MPADIRPLPCSQKDMYYVACPSAHAASLKHIHCCCCSRLLWPVQPLVVKLLGHGSGAERSEDVLGLLPDWHARPGHAAGH